MTKEEYLNKLVKGSELFLDTIPPPEENKFLFLNMNNGTYFNSKSIEEATPENHVLATYTPSWIGFLAGKLWLLYSLTHNKPFYKFAYDITKRVEKSANIVNVDTSFAIYHSACLGYNITKKKDLFDLAKIGVQSFSKLYSKNFGGLLISKPGFKHTHYRTRRKIRNIEFIIDNGEVLDLLWWWGSFDKNYYNMAYNTICKLLDYGFIKDDGSTFQCLELDENYKPLNFYTRQGYSDTSCWSRGQSWAMISFATAFEITGEKQFLEAALKVSDWYCDHLPEDYIPYYDFNDVNIPYVAKDTSAATIACCALSIMKHKTSDKFEKYQKIIDHTITSLFENYITPCGTLLGGSWGGLYHENPNEVVMPYGNYYLYELIFRELRPNDSVFVFN